MSADRIAERAGRRRKWVRDDRNAGFTILELLVGTMLFAILANIGVPRLFGSNLGLAQGHALLLADLRRARAEAMTSGDHTRFAVVDAHTYSTWRLSLVGNVWTEGGPPRSRTLPDGVAISAGADGSFEFNTRGLLTDPDATRLLRLVDSRTGFTQAVRVWPSGQVVREQ